MASVGQRKRFPVDTSFGTDEKEGKTSLLRELRQHQGGFFIHSDILPFLKQALKLRERSFV
jgi:hypothetical protein